MEQKVNYIFRINSKYPFIYCRKLKKILKPKPEFWGANCLKGCKYFNGSNQGNGVECKFEESALMDNYKKEYEKDYIILDTSNNKDIIKDIAKKVK